MLSSSGSEGKKAPAWLLHGKQSAENVGHGRRIVYEGLGFGAQVCF